jgi:hypothetical protein
MLLNDGDVVLVSNRRMFERDESRFFLGRTIASEGALLKVEGYTFVRDLSSGQIVKKDEVRIKVLSLASPGYIVYQLPRDTNINMAMIQGENGEAILADGSREIMNLSERTHCGHF